MWSTNLTARGYRNSTFEGIGNTHFREAICNRFRSLAPRFRQLLYNRDHLGGSWIEIKPDDMDGRFCPTAGKLDARDQPNTISQWQLADL